MGAEPQHWSNRTQDDVLMEPEKFLADLGWSKTGPAPGAPPPTAAVQQRYCSFCWCILPPRAVECSDCGHSLVQMDAALSARQQADRAWVPQRLWEPGKPPPSPRPAPTNRIFTSPNGVAAVPVMVTAPPAMPVAQPSFLSWKHILVAVGIGGFVGGATVAAVWVVFQTFGRPAGAGDLLTTSSGALVALSPAQLSWKNPIQELRLELVSSSGVVVADTSQGKSVGSVEPGEYRLRITDTTGRWAPPEERVLVAPAENLTVGPSSRAVAGYYVWAGKNLYAQKKLDRAERVWEKAIKHYPEGLEARLQLAALKAVQFRYDSAREQVQEVLKRDPRNVEALRLINTIHQLGEKR